MSPLQSYKGQIVWDIGTGRIYEVLGLGRRVGSLRLRDLDSNEIHFNASARWYEPTGARVEDVALPEDEPRHNHNSSGVYANCPACGTVLEDLIPPDAVEDDLHPSDNPLEWM